MLSGNFQHAPEFGQVDILELLETDTTAPDFHLAKLPFMLFRDVFSVNHRTDVHADVLLLVGECDDRPVNRFFLVVFVFELNENNY